MLMETKESATASNKKGGKVIQVTEKKEVTEVERHETRRATSEHRQTNGLKRIYERETLPRRCDKGAT